MQFSACPRGGSTHRTLDVHMQQVHHQRRSKMAVPVELRCLDRFPPDLSPLDLLVLDSHLDSLLLTHAAPRTGLFAPHGFPRGAILLRLHPAAEEDTVGCSWVEPELDPTGCRPVSLFASRFFLRHHGLPLGTTGTLRALEPVSLDRVVLGARGGRSLRGAAADALISRLLELCGPGQCLLARRGEPLPLPRTPGEQPGQLSDLLVLDCSPVTQGRITADTALVLTDISDWSDLPGTPLPHRPPQLCVSDFAHFADSLGGGRSLLDNKKLLRAGLCGALQALECRVDARVVDVQRWQGEEHLQGVDMDGCVFVSTRLLLTLGLFNREWVKLSWAAASIKGTRERLAAVTTLSLMDGSQEVTDDNTAVISETLWFNLTGGDEMSTNSCCLRIKRCQQQLNPSEPVVRRSDSFCRSASPSFATQLHLQPVASLYDNLGCYDNLLAAHFSTPRQVSAGDILSVPARKHPDLLENTEGIHRCPVLFFRVQKLHPTTAEREETHLADRVHTSLYLGLSVCSPTPCGALGAEPLWSSLTLSALNKPVDVLSSIILPHLQHSNSLSGCTVLVHGPAGSGKVTVVNAASCRLHLRLLKVDCVSLCADTPAASEAKLAVRFQQAAAVQPCVLLLRNLHLLLHPRGGGDEEARVQVALSQLLATVDNRVAVVATVCRPQQLSTGVIAAFVHQVALESPSEEQRHAMLLTLSRELHLGQDVSMERLAKLTAGFVLADLSALLVQAGRAACRRLMDASIGRHDEDLTLSGVTVLNQDFTSALETLQHAQSNAVGAPKIPNVRWDDIGGLQQVKKEILDTVQLPLQRPELLTLGLNRTGLLLFGPPGTGKTLLAKAVATECAMTFLSVKGPELINMYVGQSEENVRKVFERARSAAPCVVFFDELDSLAPSRGRSGDSGGVMDRVVSQLLAELDALHSSVGVFVIGATNRPDLLDQSLLRPGRFDKLVYVGVNDDRSSQLQVLQAVLRRFQLDSALDVRQLLERCPAQMTGADLYALCSDAMTAAIRRKIRLIEDGVDSEDSPVRLSVEDFAVALETFRPSVSEAELLHYAHIQQTLTAT